MNFGTPGMQLPKNFNNQGIQNRGFNNTPNLPNGINNSVANKVGTINKPERTFKSIDGTTWSSFEEASRHNQRYYYEQDACRKNSFK